MYVKVCCPCLQKPIPVPCPNGRLHGADPASLRGLFCEFYARLIFCDLTPDKNLPSKGDQSIQ